MSLASPKHPAFNPRYTRWCLRVERSQIHGLGVFAAEQIPKGRRVIEYAGERITQREAVKRFEKIWRSRKADKRICLFYLDKRWVIDGAVDGSGAQFINHRCDPNLRARRIRGHIFYFSRKRIRKGEELTVDYRFSKKATRVVCRCGSAICRGTINRR
jgi:SET domain-containing protein